MQSLWGGAAGAIWVGEAIEAVGCSPAVGAAKKVISALEYTTLGSMVVHWGGRESHIKKVCCK